MNTSDSLAVLPKIIEAVSTMPPAALVALVSVFSTCSLVYVVKLMHRK
jgi:hypothetical protein